MAVTIILPTSIAIPETPFTYPYAFSPPTFKRRAGKAALNTDAVKFIAAKNNIKSSIPLLFLKNLIPSPADFRMLSFISSSTFLFGIFIKNASVKKAIVKVNKSNTITNSIPAVDISAAAKTGAKKLFTEYEKAFNPPTL